MAVFFVLGLLLASSAAEPGAGLVSLKARGILGGPDVPQSEPGRGADAVLVALAAPIVPQGQIAPQGAPRPVSEDASIGDPGQPIGPVAYRPDIFIYRVQAGDVLSRIAADFGITVQTIVDANAKVKASSLQIGEELTILPVSGLVYAARDGDELDSIAALFSVPEDRIRQANPLVNFAVLGAGTQVVIPGVRAGAASALRAGGELLDARDKFAMPTDGFNWGRLHAHNAVDIANNCGTPIRAAAEGLVIPDESYGDGMSGWNGGYGHFILIEHPFGDGVRTRYAHLDKVSVEIGAYVKQGQEIGTMGQTGDATGCHLHFEVYGAANPFVK